MTTLSTPQHPAGTMHGPPPPTFFIDGPNIMADDLHDQRWDQPNVYPMPRTPIVPT